MYVHLTSSTYTLHHVGTRCTYTLHHVIMWVQGVGTPYIKYVRGVRTPYIKYVRGVRTPHIMYVVGVRTPYCPYIKYVRGVRTLYTYGMYANYVRYCIPITFPATQTGQTVNNKQQTASHKNLTCVPPSASHGPQCFHVLQISSRSRGNSEFYPFQTRIYS